MVGLSEQRARPSAGFSPKTRQPSAAEWKQTRPSAAEWASRLRLTKVGDEYKGPCPICGGVDRFHTQDRQGRPGLVHCRGCGDQPDFYQTVLRLMFGEDYAPRRRDTWWSEREVLRGSKPVSAKDHARPTAETAQNVLKAAGRVPKWVTRVWRAALLVYAPPNGLQWLGQRALRATLGVRWNTAAGALVAPLGNNGAAVHLMIVGRDGGKVRVPWCGSQTDKITLGPLKGRGFAVNKHQHGALYVTEGVADALAIAHETGQAAVAAIGTAGLSGVPLALLATTGCPYQSIVLVPDGSDQHVIKTAEQQRQQVEDAAVRQGYSVEVTIDTHWKPDPAGAWERRASEGGLRQRVELAATFGAGTRAVAAPAIQPPEHPDDTPDETPDETTSSPDDTPASPASTPAQEVIDWLTRQVVEPWRGSDSE